MNLITRKAVSITAVFYLLALKAYYRFKPRAACKLADTWAEHPVAFLMIGGTFIQRLRYINRQAQYYATHEFGHYQTEHSVCSLCHYMCIDPRYANHPDCVAADEDYQQYQREMEEAYTQEQQELEEHYARLDAKAAEREHYNRLMDDFCEAEGCYELGPFSIGVCPLHDPYCKHCGYNPCECYDDADWPDDDEDEDEGPRIADCCGRPYYDCTCAEEESLRRYNATPLEQRCGPWTA